MPEEQVRPSCRTPGWHHQRGEYLKYPESSGKLHSKRLKIAIEISTVPHKGNAEFSLHKKTPVKKCRAIC